MRALYPLVLTGLLAGAGSACAAELKLDLAGAAYKGSPTFEVMVGGEVVGSGTVDAPLGGTAQSFSFTVPDQLLAANPDLRIRLTNDIWEGQGKDRNLYILKASIAGTEVAPESFHVLHAKDSTEVPRKLQQGYLGVWSGYEVAVAAAPATGWFTTATVASTDTNTVPAKTVTASCQAKLTIGPFNKRVAELSSKQKKQLDALLGKTKGGECAITLTGYGSLDGSRAANQRVSKGRAQSVLDYLVDRGGRFAAKKVVGGGGTDRFGAKAEKNRVVVLTLATHK